MGAAEKGQLGGDPAVPPLCSPAARQPPCAQTLTLVRTSPTNTYDDYKCVWMAAWGLVCAAGGRVAL